MFRVGEWRCDRKSMVFLLIPFPGSDTVVIGASMSELNGNFCVCVSVSYVLVLVLINLFIRFLLCQYVLQNFTGGTYIPCATILLGIVLLMIFINILVAHVIYTRPQNVVTKSSGFAYTILAKM